MATNCDGAKTGVPACGTGITGRFSFVVTELADLVRELRGRGWSRPEPPSGVGRDRAPSEPPVGPDKG